MRSSVRQGLKYNYAMFSAHRLKAAASMETFPGQLASTE